MRYDVGMSPRLPTVCRRVRVVCCMAVLCLLSANATLAQQQEPTEWSRDLLSERDLNRKEELACLRGNRGILSETVGILASRERHGLAVVSVAGQYFERSDLDQNTPGVLRLLANRPDIGAQSLAYAALSPHAPELIVGFASSDAAGDQQIAARMIAATAVMRNDQDRASMRPAANVNGASNRLNINYRDQLQQLLGSRDPITLEYALLAVGIDRVAAVREAVTPHLTSREPGVAMAAQFAAARLGMDVDEQAILRQIGRRPPRPVDLPALSYDPRETPRVYAIMAAGAAGLESAVDPLTALVTDADLHNAVAAARALGEIGGEGRAVALLGLMTEEMPWPVRMAIYDAAGANPDKAAVPLLRERFDAETGRFRQDALYALLSIVAGAPEENTLFSFDTWWQEHGEAFAVDAEATQAWRSATRMDEVEVEPIAGFYESSVISDRPVFAVDASRSMAGAQIDSLKQTLSDVVLDFPERVRFNIVDFGGHCRVLAPGGLIPAANRRAAMQQFIYEMELTLGTRSYDAIERAMEIPGMDTVHYLSDGAPYGSHLRSWQRMDYATRLRCRTAPVAVYMIYFPPNANARNANNAISRGMEGFAHSHAGRFHVCVPQ